MIRKRADGRWEGRIIVGHKEDGKPIYKAVLAKTPKELIPKLNQLKETYAGVELTEASRMTLGERLDKWLTEYKAPMIRKNTADGYRRYIDNHIKPHLGDKTITQVTTADVQKMYNTLKESGRIRESNTRTVTIIACIFPLAFIDAYMGLGSDSLFLFGAIGAVVFLAIYAVVLYVLNYSFFEKGVYTLSEKEEAVYRHNHKLKKRVALVTTAVLAITLIVHVAISEIWGAYEIMENMDGAVFEDYDSFGEYMAQDIGYGWGYTDSHTAPVDVPEIYVDIRTITDDSGNVLYEYNHCNDSVIRIRHDGGLPITVYTEGHLRGAENIVLLRNAGFVVLYLIEAAAGILIYRKKREK